MLRHTLAVAVLSLLPAVLPAQAPAAVVGKWTIEWELARRVMNDEVEPINATGMMVVEASGDSLIATIEVQKRSDGMAPAPRPITMSGRRTADGATFTQVQQVRLNMNGEEAVRRATVTWTVRVQGDALSGETRREIEGDVMPQTSPAPLSGKRVAK